MAVLLIVAGLFVAVIAAVGVLAYRANRKRIAELAAFATSHGLTYTARDDSLVNQWRCDPFTNTGFDRRATEVLHGTFRDRAAYALKYAYKTQSTDSEGRRSTQTHTFGVTVLAMPGWLPDVDVGLENVLTRLGSALGLDDIELESEDFNRRYRVKSADRKLATDVLPPRTMELLLAGPACAFHLTGASAVASHSGRHSPAQIEARWTMLDGVIGNIPSFVWKDAGAQ